MFSEDSLEIRQARSSKFHGRTLEFVVYIKSELSNALLFPSAQILLSSRYAPGCLLASRADLALEMCSEQNTIADAPILLSLWSYAFWSHCFVISR